MHKTLFVIVMVTAASVQAAEIRGNIQFATRPEGSVQAIYEALTAAGKRISNMAGLTVGGDAASVSSTTHKPRCTTMKCDPKTGLTFEHVKLPPGKYFIAVKNRNCLDWKVVDLPADTTVVNTSLTLDPKQTGKVQVQISQGAGDYQVLLTPLGAGNQPPVPGLDLAKSFHLRLAVDVKNGQTAGFDGVKAGCYQVVLRAAKRSGSARTGVSTVFTPLATATVAVEAGREARVTLP
jgi:hypothetical protein